MRNLTIRNTLRSHWISRLWIFSILSITAVSIAYAQSTFPNRPIKFIAPFPPGGTSDVIGRIMAQKLSDALGQSVIVENRPGASGNIGHDIAAKAAPDGYTLLLSNSSTVVNNPHLFKQMSFDWYKDFSPISMVAIAGLVLVVHPSVPVKSVSELTTLAKSKPGQLNFGSGGKGIQSHISGEMYKTAANVDIVHIPYKGGGQAMTDLLGGNIPLVYTAVAGANQHIKSGRLTPLAVSSFQRSSSLPDVPTFMESGIKDFELSSWVGLLAPAKTPRPVIMRLNQALNEILASTEGKERLNAMGITATVGSPEKFSEQIKFDLTRFGAIVKNANIKAE
jgi:tripartite-type tricarboxylate transporter receptor subunit TctC